MDRRMIANIGLWSALLVTAAALFGSPNALLADLWYWWPTAAKAQVINSLAMFGLGALAVGAWAAINKPDRASMAAAMVPAALAAVCVGFATVDCDYLFRCP